MILPGTDTKSSVFCITGKMPRKTGADLGSFTRGDKSPTGKFHEKYAKSLDILLRMGYPIKALEKGESMPWRGKQCDEAGDCRLWRVTSVEYVRQSGGWETNGTRVSQSGNCLHGQASPSAKPTGAENAGRLRLCSRLLSCPKCDTRGGVAGFPPNAVNQNLITFAMQGGTHSGKDRQNQNSLESLRPPGD